MRRRSMPIATIVLLVPMIAIGFPGPEPATTLGDPTLEYEVVENTSVLVRSGKLHAWLIGNVKGPPFHLAGYNGLAALHYDGGPSPFVPFYSGLNLEHVNNGLHYPDRDLVFEPRRHPMEMRKIDETTYELYQAPLPETGLESCTRFEFVAPHYIDVTFECIPRLDKFPYGYLNIFWASYIDQPEDMGFYFVGREKTKRWWNIDWMRGMSPEHGFYSTHRWAGDRREFGRDDDFSLRLVFNESPYEYTKSVYYGRFAEFAWIVMFRQKDKVRLTHSPSGGGQGNPAWDFQWFIEKPEVGRLYQLKYRAAYKPWVDRRDVLMEYQSWVRGPRHPFNYSIGAGFSR